MNLFLRPCAADDLSALQALSRSTFEETFGPLNTPENMRAYMDGAYDAEQLRSELNNPLSRFYFLYADGELAGYIKVNDGSAQTELGDPESLELERIYVTARRQGMRLGETLLRKAEERARELGKRRLWLGVWEKNEKALRFYRKHGFARIGEHAFVMGDDEQTDFLMAKEL